MKLPRLISRLAFAGNLCEFRKEAKRILDQAFNVAPMARLLR